MLAFVLGKREAPKESEYVEYDDWTYEPAKKSDDNKQTNYYHSAPKEETYIQYESYYERPKEKPVEETYVYRTDNSGYTETVYTKKQEPINYRDYTDYRDARDYKQSQDKRTYRSDYDNHRTYSTQDRTG